MENSEDLKPLKVAKICIPGKVILIGEHAVLYGNSAIVSAVDLKVHLSVTLYESNNPEENSKKENPEAVLALKLFPSPVYLEIDGTNEIPISSGFGSSASYCCGLAACFLKLLDREIDLNQIVLLGKEAECVFHGVSSGLDPAIVTFGGLLEFQNGQFKQTEIRGIEEIQFLVVNTKQKRSTKDLENPEEHTQILKELQDLANTLKNFSNKNQIIEIFDRAQQLIAKWGISTDKISKIFEVAKQCNTAGKITGAGGGGCLLLVDSPELEQQIKSQIEDIETYRVRLGQPGLIFEC